MKSKFRKMIFFQGHFKKVIFWCVKYANLFWRPGKKIPSNSKIFSYLFCYDILQSNIRNQLIFICKTSNAKRGKKF